MPTASIATLFVWIPLLLLGAPSVNAEEAALRCGGGATVFHLLLDSTTGQAKLILDTETVVGRGEMTDTHYRFVFPKTDERYETHITVNRYSRIYNWEHGGSPFRSGSLENVSHNGQCETAPNRPEI